MTLSPQRLEKAAEALHYALAEAGLIRIQSWPPTNSKLAEAIRQVASANISAYLGDDMVVVPREPTAKMRRAAVEADDKRTGSETCAHIYRAMLSAELTERDAG